MEGLIRPLSRALLFVCLSISVCNTQAFGSDEAALLERVQNAAKAGDAKAEYQLANLYLSGARPGLGLAAQGGRAGVCRRPT